MWKGLNISIACACVCCADIRQATNTFTCSRRASSKLFIPPCLYEQGGLGFLELKFAQSCAYDVDTWFTFNAMCIAHLILFSESNANLETETVLSPL